MTRDQEIALAYERMASATSRYGYYRRDGPGHLGVGFVELILSTFRRDQAGNYLDLDGRTTPEQALTPGGMYPARTEQGKYVVYLGGSLGSIFVDKDSTRILGWDLSYLSHQQLELFPK